jgi:hypothetical protein
MGINKKSLDNLVYPINKNIPVEWDNEWFQSQKELALFLGVSTGRVSANLNKGWRLKGHYVKRSEFEF